MIDRPLLFSKFTINSNRKAFEFANVSGAKQSVAYKKKLQAILMKVIISNFSFYFKLILLIISLL